MFAYTTYSFLITHNNAHQHFIRPNEIGQEIWVDKVLRAFEGCVSVALQQSGFW